MSEAIKAWIKRQSENAGNASCDNAETVEYYFGQGLEKGIEIAEGFAEYSKHWYLLKKYIWVPPDKGNVPFEELKPEDMLTTSQLLEKYLLTIENKEK
jgi:hypothetical protein